MFLCAFCKIEKDSNEFTKDNRLSRGHTTKCKICTNVHKQKLSVPHKNKKNEKERQRYWKDREPFVKMFPELNNRKQESILRARLWRKQNSAHRNALKAAYKSAKAGATPSWLNKKQKQQIIDLHWLAKDCEIVSGQKYQVDHIIPIRGKDVCGLHVPWNMQVLPEDINREKSNRYG